MKTRKPRPKPRAAEIVQPSYQPSGAELQENVRINAAFEGGVEALMQSVKIR